MMAETLSAMQAKILALVMGGFHYKEIADMLCISPYCVKMEVDIISDLIGAFDPLFSLPEETENH
jgi:DNA-binding NarL/FixJ family response regulator